MATNPMHQFNVYRIGPEIKIDQIDISFTNASLFMIISCISILLIFNLGSSKKNIVPNKIQLLAELSYTFISKMINVHNVVLLLIKHLQIVGIGSSGRVN